MSMVLRCNKFLRLASKWGTKKRFCSYDSTQSDKGLILGVYHADGTNELTPAAECLNAATDGRLYEQIDLIGDIKEGKAYQFYGLHDEYKSIAIVGLGASNKEFNRAEGICDQRESIRKAVAAGCKLLQSNESIRMIEVEPFGDCEAAAEGAKLSLWKFQEFRAKKKPEVDVRPFNASTDEVDAWCRGCAQADGQNIARRLAEMPSNLLTPSIFADFVDKQFSESDRIDVRIYDEDWAREKNMGAFLSVARGSCEPARFIELTYKNSDVSQPYALVGKGVTFDSGGISIKPSAKMDEMRADMSGAACLIGAIYALDRLAVEKHVKVFIPLVENMPGGSATKPGDVVTAMNGKTICIDNTDAEGRLILADALCYSAEFQPNWIVDIATLTGAMVVAIGNTATGVFSNSTELYKELEEAGSKTGDRVWRFPLWKAYQKQVTEYDAYDVNNVGKGKGGGACTAAAFLSEFVPPYTPWMHLDIASVMGPGDGGYVSGMTGRPTRTLIEFIIRHQSIC